MHRVAEESRQVREELQVTNVVVVEAAQLTRTICILGGTAGEGGGRAKGAEGIPLSPKQRGGGLEERRHRRGAHSRHCG